MQIKNILFSIIAALVIIILFNNKEEATFWLFGDIRTSKLFILGVFFLLGVITGGILFRRKRTHPKEYSINNSQMDPSENTASNLSPEDQKFLERD
ncbi:hypothetical protein ORI89_12405 [Sphingobacterium sp. UT-1RO-CII-1]|uniref:hypothetical protein n=1 Tax=Sphingobacterium sp. UT-1RO-CII-1 TaxID=2995225 RepID=UPI00227A1962|nr:hypothetical protein [Sphingobacterium sp. UT-1RO-CII-1]MCY4780458.1 hypothetical protein [Sphingobacterium sp. UT-1RO-CII-1]